MIFPWWWSWAIKLALQPLHPPSEGGPLPLCLVQLLWQLTKSSSGECVKFPEFHLSENYHVLCSAAQRWADLWKAVDACHIYTKKRLTTDQEEEDTRVQYRLSAKDIRHLSIERRQSDDWGETLLQGNVNMLTLRLIACKSYRKECDIRSEIKRFIENTLTFLPSYTDSRHPICWQ